MTPLLPQRRLNRQYEESARHDDAADLVPPIRQRAVSRPGDLWILGDHKLLCADAREPSSYTLLLERKARVVSPTRPIT
jgi:hypothetical protein